MVSFSAVKFSARLLNNFLCASFFPITRLPTDAHIMEISVDYHGSEFCSWALCNLHQESIFKILSVSGQSASPLVVMQILFTGLLLSCVCISVWEYSLSLLLQHLIILTLLYSSLVFYFIQLIPRIGTIPSHSSCASNYHVPHWRWLIKTRPW